MIRIAKPTAPTTLTTRGATARAALIAAHDAGERDFEFKSAIYAADDVKAALEAAQHGKCAFCESRITHITYGDIEHWRPKGGWKQADGDELTKPGYYWLAYEWDNLFLSCTLCNQQFKKNLFPLRIQKHRARSHKAKLAREQPLLLHPANDEPHKHLRFREEMAYAVRGSHKGQTTIDVLGLNREKLADERARRLKTLKLVQSTLALLRADSDAASVAKIAEWEAWLQAQCEQTGEYSAMVRDFLAS